jgi:hypothetical protein
LVDKVTFVEGFMFDLIFLAELFYRKSMHIFKMHVNNHGCILSIIFAANSLLISEQHGLGIHEVQFLGIKNSSELVAELV